MNFLTSQMMTWEKRLIMHMKDKIKYNLKQKPKLVNFRVYLVQHQNQIFNLPDQ